ncbi:TetR/AcrR family transcriptional regulator [Brevibacillus ginsengisoli]|uniref:TetR/AcrR family transcriptional regulator n=1 Tax=Brevibacillus ginsengisoli TaxID=363854 RepID=UPI003CE7DBBC
MESRKSQIVDLTLRLIQKKGYVAFSYDDLAKQLGVTKASIHYHFEKKEDLGLAVCEQLQHILYNSFQTIDQLPTIEEKFNRYIEGRLSWLQENEICAITSLQSDFQSLPLSLQERLKELSQMELTFLSKMLSEAKTEGKIHHFEKLDELAVTIICCLKGAFQYDRVLGNGFVTIVKNQLERLLR